jgi:RecG-like helicase
MNSIDLGFIERMVFNHKYHKPNILVMSATLIPRTLTLAAYGDMNESKLTEKPLGRKPIITSSLSLKNENQLIDRIKEKIKSSSSKFYWVCPLIEEFEELDLKAAEERYKILKKYFKNKVLLMHGRLSEIEKEEIMTKFKNEDYKILVSTTVIECWCRYSLCNNNRNRTCRKIRFSSTSSIKRSCW